MSVPLPSYFQGPPRGAPDNVGLRTSIEWTARPSSHAAGSRSGDNDGGAADPVRATSAAPRTYRVATDVLWATKKRMLYSRLIEGRRASRPIPSVSAYGSTVVTGFGIHQGGYSQISTTALV